MNGSLVAVAGEKVRDRDLFTLDDWFMEAPERRGEQPLFEYHGRDLLVHPWTPIP